MRPSRIELHDAAQHQPVFSRPQAADVRRKLLRQHGNGAIRKIHAGSAQPRFQVKVRSRPHVLAPHRQCAPAARSHPPSPRSVTSTASSKSRAVSPSMVTIGSPRKSAPARNFFLIKMRNLTRLRQHFSGKTRGNWCLRIIISTSTPKSSGSPSTSITRPIGGRVGVGQLVISTSTTRPSRLSCACGRSSLAPSTRCGVAPPSRPAIPVHRESGSAASSARRNGTTRVPNAPDPVRRVMKHAHHRRIAPLQHPRNPPQPPPIGARRSQFHQHLVALHGAVDLIRRNENVVVLPRPPAARCGRTNP